MLRKHSHLLYPVSVCFLAIFTLYCNSFPLSTHKTWIIDDATGKRVKLICTHWAAHARPMLAEGLDKRPLDDIAAQVTNTGFNCVRLSYATYMFTRFTNHSVAETLHNLDIPEIVQAIQEHNPSILKMTHLQAYEAVVDALGARGVMVLVDNHVSEPKWCCGSGDGNAFFGDRHFQPDEWLQGLTFVAKHFKGKPHVVAMDLRNELRGTLQNVPDWYMHVTQAATTIHQHNPDVLVVISGLNYDSDFTFLKEKPLDLDIGNKVVYEAHLYSFSGPSQDRWTRQPLNWVCNSTIDSLNSQSAFLMSGENPAPLLISEFGYDMTGSNSDDNNFVPCFKAFAASVDLDWCLWAFQGTYYFRGGNVGPNESYGVLDHDWKNLKDPKFPEKFQLLQRIVRDPNSNLAKSHIFFHPLSGNCTNVNSDYQLVLGDCKNPSLWSSEGDGSPIRLMDSALCLKAAGEGLPVTLSEDCLSPQSSWKTLSATRLHLAALDNNGGRLCLQRDPDSTIVTRKCICIGDDDSHCLDNPQSQWFQLVSTNVRPS